MFSNATLALPAGLAGSYMSTYYHVRRDPCNRQHPAHCQLAQRGRPAQRGHPFITKVVTSNWACTDHFDVDEEEEEEPQPKRKAAAKKPAAAKKAAASTKAKRKAADNDHQDEDVAEEDDEDPEEEEESEDEKPKKKRQKAAGGGSMLSPELQAFVGAEKMGRFQVSR